MPTVETVVVQRDGKFLIAPSGERYPIVSDCKILPFYKQHDAIARAFDVDPNDHSLNFDIYNPSAPVINPPGRYWLVRVDGPYNQTKSMTFQEVKRDLIEYPKATFENHEDPSAINITSDNKINKPAILFRAVEIKRSEDEATVSRWKQVFYLGSTMDHLDRIFEGPEGMKDICPVKKNPAIKTKRAQGFYTRPRFPGIPSLGGDGQIGYTELDSFADLAKISPTKFDIYHAFLIPYLFPDGQWGGVNDALEIGEEGPYFGSNLLFTHKAWKDFDSGKQHRHYASTWFIDNIKTGTVINFDYNMTRSDIYPNGPCKDQNISTDLWDVNYGMAIREVRHDFITVEAGIGDTIAVQFKTPNPLRFLDFRGNKRFFLVPSLPTIYSQPEKLAA